MRHCAQVTGGSTCLSPIAEANNLGVVSAPVAASVKTHSAVRQISSSFPPSCQKGQRASIASIDCPGGHPMRARVVPEAVDDGSDFNAM